MSKIDDLYSAEKEHFESRDIKVDYPGSNSNTGRYTDESFARKLAESNSLARRNEYEERVFDDALITVAEKVNPKDHMIQEYVGMKKSTIEILEQGGTWKRTRNGFVNRSNFRFTSDQIAFVSNEIKKVKGVYGIDGTLTPRKTAYFEKNAKAFELLGKIEIVLDGFYREHKREVDAVIVETYLSSQAAKDIYGAEAIRNVNNLPYLPPITRKTEKYIIEETTYVKDLLDRYGSALIIRVTEILNDLDKVEDVESYAKEFAKGVAPLAAIVPDDRFDSITLTYAKAPFVIARLVGMYSIIGKKFESVVKKELRYFGAEEPDLTKEGTGLGHA